MLSTKALENKKAWENLALSDSERKEFEEILNSSDEKEIEEAFGSYLEFGTGGLRGIMGPGTNRMNRFTVGTATQGLSQYLKKCFPTDPLKVAIAYDSRKNSKEFSGIAAEIFSANGIEVFLFEELRPTPELSYAIRELGCHSGLVITASHNPPEYNGYKAYWNDGSQIIAPHDKEIVETVKSLAFEDIKFDGNKDLISPLGEELDENYLEYLMGLLPKKETESKNSELSIIYSSLHGTGITLVPKILEKGGFYDVQLVKEQSIPDGDFPTVVSPNPEERAALKLSINDAKKKNADLVMATDPDSDRVGIAVKDPNGNFILLNGNQTGALLFYYYLKTHREQIEDPKKYFSVKTVVSSDLLSEISESFGIPCHETLTGFKYIAELIRKFEGEKKYLIGAEESYGYLIGDGVRDKDAVGACLMIAQLGAWAKSMNMSFFDLLGEIYEQYGLYCESLRSLVKKGAEGKKEIQKMMERFRKEGIKEIHGSKVIIKRDFIIAEEEDLQNGKKKKIDFPISNVLQFTAENGSKISIRPSGTEPKIKFYLSCKEKIKGGNWLDRFNELEVLNQEFLRKLSL